LFQVNHFRNQHHIHVYGTDIPEPVATFEQLQAEYSIDARIMSNLQSMGFHTPTVIEMQAIPVMIHVRLVMICQAIPVMISVILVIIFQLQLSYSFDFLVIVILLVNYKGIFQL